jgi:hypothetical protein
LAGLIEGWCKNIFVGGWLSVPPLFRRVVTPIGLAAGVSLWIAPPAVLLAGLVGWVVGPLLLWSAVVYGVSVAIWAHCTHGMRGPPQYGFLYPLEALVGAHIFLRSWTRGQNIEWTGRRYTVRAPLEMP